MNIGIDIDNVISNFDEVLKKEFLEHDKELRNTGIVNPEAHMTNGMFDWSDDEVWSFYLKNIERIIKSLDVIEGAKEYIEKLKEDGHTIVIITGRDNGEYTNPVEMTQKWLKKNNIYYDKLIFTNAYKNDKHGKTEKCFENNIDIMIDDSKYNCESIANAGTKTIYMKDAPSYDITDNPNVVTLYNWGEVYRYLHEIN